MRRNLLDTLGNGLSDLEPDYLQTQVQPDFGQIFLWFIANIASRMGSPVIG